MKFLFPIVCLSLGLQACAAFPTTLATAFLTGAGQADASYKALLADRAALTDEANFSEESRAFLDGSDKGPADMVSCANSRHQSVREYEATLHDQRLRNLTALDTYVASLKVYMTASDEILAFKRLVTASEGLAKTLSASEEALLAVPIDAGVQVLDAVESALRARKLRATVLANRKRLQTIASDLEAGLRPLSREIDATLNRWENCEHQKLIFMRDQGQEPSIVALELRYRQFHDLRSKLRSSIADEATVKEAFQSLPKLHDAIIAADDPAAAIDQLNAVLSPTVALIKGAQKAAS